MPHSWPARPLKRSQKQIARRISAPVSILFLKWRSVLRSCAVSSSTCCSCTFNLSNCCCENNWTLSWPLVLKKKDCTQTVKMKIYCMDRDKQNTWYRPRVFYCNIDAGADPGFFLGGGALVSCSTSTPINHIVFFLQNTSCIRKPQVISGGGGAHPLHPPPRSAPAT